MSPAARRPVSGRYVGRRGNYEVELRVDVDGPRPCHRVSADYFDASDRRYLGSMRVEAPSVSFAAARVTIAGTGTFTQRWASRRIAVTIPRVARSAPPAAATLRHLGPAGGGGTYRCAFASESFRTIELEEACQDSVQRFTAYDTSSRPTPGQARTLDVRAAYAEAGIEVLAAGPPAVVDTSRAGADATWSDAELQAAMTQYFGALDDRPRWAIWLMHATVHDDPELAGLMFDDSGRQRQGCAVFYGVTHKSDPANLRAQLHTCVHELGHGFNLMHCWQKSRAEPPVPSRPAAASWMNYPQLFPGGEHRYWQEFDFQFDDLELEHLRHGTRDSVIPGGNPFADDAALRRAGAGEDDAVNPALRLKLTAPAAPAYGVAVTVGLELTSTSRTGDEVPATLGPRPATVDIAIAKPNGKTIVFAPLTQHCRGAGTITLGAHRQALRDDAFIHYGKGGFTFDEPGTYRARARFTAVDGSVVTSNAVTIRIAPPLTRADRDVERLVAGDDRVGTLLSLMGSDAPELQAGDDLLREVIERHPAHPAAAVARLVRATNAARPFKSVDARGVVRVRAARAEEAHALADGIVDIARVHHAAQRATGLDSERRVVMAMLPRAGIPAVAQAVNGMIRARTSEVAKALPVLGPAAVAAAARSTVTNRRSFAERGA